MVERMNPEVKALWLTELRDDNYTQGVEALKQQTDGKWKHCCLGVLCELAVRAGIVRAEHVPALKDQTAMAFVSVNDETDNDTGFLPLAVQEWAGIATRNGRFGDDGNDCLSVQNDAGMSFAEIADIIEEKL